MSTLSPAQLPPLPPLPGVSYVMPVLNEVDYLANAVKTILAQDYTGEKELVLALAPSQDGTDELAAELAAADSRIHLVKNPERDIPIGLNLAIAASKYPVIVRVDAHSELTPDYTTRGIAALKSEQAVNVGGIMSAAGNTPTQRAIAAAYNSPYGLGGGAYHGDQLPGPAESAYLGVFRREAITAAGGYDPAIRRGEDWELNLRIRRLGGLVWFEPSLGVTYWPRDSFKALSKQFFATGAWRAVLTKRYPRETPWRFFAPGTLVILLTLSGVGSVLHLCGGPTWLLLSYVVPTTYLLGILFAAFRLRLKGFKERMLGLATLITMHLSWGTGFLFGLLGGAGRTVDRSRVV